jgi:hypothetical protein
LTSELPIEELFRAAGSRAESLRVRVSAGLTSRPGRSAADLRHAFYRLMRIPEPGRHRAVEPVVVPTKRGW